MAPRETEDNAYAKFWGDKQRALWYVMVFLEWSIGHLHDGVILLPRPESFSFSFHIFIWKSQRGLNNKSPDLHKH